MHPKKHASQDVSSTIRTHQAVFYTCAMDDWNYRSTRPLREIPRGGDNHAFLLKALHEASGELEGEFYNLTPRQLAYHDLDEWSLIQIAGHLRDREEYVLEQLQTILSTRSPELRAIDLESIVEENDYSPNAIHELLYGYLDLRERALYRLYDLSPAQWTRGGEHPYRGRLTVEQIVKEMNEHDLAHLWQVMRLKQALV
jgi:DinB superfamily